MTGDLELDRVQRHRFRQMTSWLLFCVGLGLLLTMADLGLFLLAVLVVTFSLLVSWMLAELGLRELLVVRTASCQEIEIADAITVRVELENSKRLPSPWLFWRDLTHESLLCEGTTCYLSTVRAGKSVSIEYRLTASRRGFFPVGPTLIESSGPLGLIERFRIDSAVSFVTVFPRSIAIGKGWPVGHQPVHQVPRRRSLYEDPSRFIGVRDYRPGDSLRRVHWRATARTGKLQVRLFQPTVLQGMQLAVDMYEPEFRDTALADFAVTVACSLAEFVLRGSQSVGLLSNGADAAELYPRQWTGSTFRRFGDAEQYATATKSARRRRPIEVGPGRGAWQRATLRCALARLVPADASPLAEMLALELPRIPRSLVLGVVTPSLTPELMGTLTTLRSHGIEMIVVWLRRPGQELQIPLTTPRGLRVYPVANEGDLQRLGAERL